MPRSLQRIKEPETFELGKTITLAITQARTLHKQTDDLTDQVEYLLSRKKQEESSLERIIQEKADTLKLKQQLIDTIVAKRAEFLEFVGTKQRELEATEADLAKKLADFATSSADKLKGLESTKQELDIQTQELEKQKQSITATVRGELLSDIQALEIREAAVKSREDANTIERERLEHLDRTLDTKLENLTVKDADIKAQIDVLATREREVTVRLHNIAQDEQKLADSRRGVGQAIADIETQLALVAREKDKNRSDRETIQAMHIELNKRKQELDYREVHVRDVEATRLTH